MFEQKKNIQNYYKSGVEGLKWKWEAKLAQASRTNNGRNGREGSRLSLVLRVAGPEEA